VNSPLGQDPALLLKQEGVPMFSVDLNTREGDSHIIVALRGELDVTDAASVAATIAAAAAHDLEIIVDLAGLDFIDSRGGAALARGRMHARHAGGDLALAAPQQQVLRVLTLTRLIEVFLVHASVDEAARGTGRSQRPAPPVAGSPVLLAAT
jgi:anti-sigma B factor antagonist